MARIAFSRASGLAEQFHDHKLVTRIERSRRLVCEQHRRLRRQRTRERDARLLAAG